MQINDPKLQLCNYLCFHSYFFSTLNYYRLLPSLAGNYLIDDGWAWNCKWNVLWLGTFWIWSSDMSIIFCNNVILETKKYCKVKYKTVELMQYKICFVLCKILDILFLTIFWLLSSISVFGNFCKSWIWSICLPISPKGTERLETV